MRKFLISYTPINKYNNGITQHSLIELSKETGNIGTDAKNALNIFIARNGNLKKNNILSIQELDAMNFPIGESIVPMDNTSIIPTGR